MLHPLVSGSKSLTGFKLYAISDNIVVVPCKQTQRVRPNNVASICITSLAIIFKKVSNLYFNMVNSSAITNIHICIK